ncbi:hypothetical protein BgAZ_108940 [Babesia gibsoni]|uniref:Uncharacterized protein n=1 Tax=Babesia gibsoni TaxID=33632 RepID=A0AAD8UW98_BABGI|nr:hypothetical protein BgAZ_108940 [Babesia gibsoni]
MVGVSYAIVYINAVLFLECTVAKSFGRLDTPPLEVYPDAVFPEDINAAARAVEQQKLVQDEVNELERNEKKLRESFRAAKGDGIWRKVTSLETKNGLSNLYLADAPVVYLTIPAILPDEQIDILDWTKTLLIRHRQVEEIKTCKQEIKNLRKRHDAEWERMRAVSLQFSTDRSKLSEFKALKQELDLLDKRIDEEAERLYKLEEVEDALIKKEGAADEAAGEESKLEAREQELADAADEEDEEDEHGTDL